MTVPFVDLKRLHAPISGEIDAEIKKIVDNNSFILGEAVKQFEEDFASYCGAKHAIGVNSGTSALHLALLALGVGEGDEVITVPNTFIATTEAISMCNAKPVFVDVEKESFNMDPSKLKEKISDKTKAIIPVHLYGQPADMDPIKELAAEKSIPVVEDACQAHGAEYKGKKAGSLGEAGCFSFYPAKNLGAFGEGGMLVSDSEELIEKANLLRAHGEKPKNVHSVIGFNYRMAGMQGAVLKTKLKQLDKWNESRRESVKVYNDLLQQANLVLPKEMDYSRHVYHLYVVRAQNRDKVRETLSQQGIATGIHYLTPIHLQSAYSFLGLKKGDFPVAEKAMNEIISLPIFPFMKQEEIEEVCSKVKEATK